MPLDALEFTRLCAFIEYPAEGIAEVLVEDYGISEGVAIAVARKALRDHQEQDVTDAHTVTEYEAAVAAEWEVE